MCYTDHMTEGLSYKCVTSFHRGNGIQSGTSYRGSPFRLSQPQGEVRVSGQEGLHIVHNVAPTPG